MSLDSILVSSVVSVSILFTELHECVYFLVLVQHMVGICCEILTFYILLYQILVFPLVSYRNMHLPIVLCCGTQRALFTNKTIIRLVPNH